MKSTGGFCKKDVVVVLLCAIFLMATLGAAGNIGRRRAKEALCLANLHQWGNIHRMYANDNDGYFCRRTWVQYLYPYYHDNNDLRLCPAATKPANPDMHHAGAHNPMDAFHAWGYDPDRRSAIDLAASLGVPVDQVPAKYLALNYAAISYGANHWTNSLLEPGYGPYPGVSSNDHWQHTSIQGGDNVPLLADAVFFGAWPKDTEAPPHRLAGFSLLRSTMDGYVNFPTFCLNRHNGGTNCLFADFSVRKIGVKELWKLKWHRRFNTNGPWTVQNGVIPDWPSWMADFREY